MRGPAAMHTISSPQNPLVKEIRWAIQHGSLTRDGCVVADTFHLLEEALRSHCEIQAILVSEEAVAAFEPGSPALGAVHFAVVSEKVFRALVTTETSQGILALVKPRTWTFDQVLGGNALAVVLDGIQDPGNAGTIVRSAEAFGATGVVFLKGSVNPWNPKTVRASAGSLFRMPMVDSIEQPPLMAAIAERRLQLYATISGAELQVSDADFTSPCAIVIGGEAHGVSGIAREHARAIAIRTIGVESLNAAIAASITLYEASRQRRQRA